MLPCSLRDYDKPPWQARTQVHRLGAFGSFNRSANLSNVLQHMYMWMWFSTSEPSTLTLEDPWWTFEELTQQEVGGGM